MQSKRKQTNIKNRKEDSIMKKLIITALVLSVAASAAKRYVPQQTKDEIKSLLKKQSAQTETTGNTTVIVTERNAEKSLETTLDGELSKEIYEYMKNNDIIGSVTVLDDDGAVRALVSYDENNYGPVIPALTPQRPGSTFKMLSGVLASAYGLTEYEDKGYIEEWGVNNWDCNGSPYVLPQHINLVSALVNSSNCFFAELFNDLGAERISSSLNSLFRFNEPIVCDFGTIENTIDLDGTYNIVRAGFGQRENVPPVYLGMVAQAIVNGGELKKPYMFDKAAGGVISVIPKEYTEDVKEGMRIIAGNFNSDSGTLYVKPGTAESGMGEPDVHNIVGAVEKDNGEVVSVVFQQLNSPNAYASGDIEHFEYVLDLVNNNEQEE